MIISMADFKRFMDGENFTPTEDTSEGAHFDAMAFWDAQLQQPSNPAIADDVVAVGAQAVNNPQAANTVPDAAKEDKKSSKLSRALDLVKEHGCEFWHNQDNEAFVSFNVGGHIEHWRVDSMAFGEWLSHASFVGGIGSLNKDVLSEVRAALTGRAKYQGSKYDTAVRVALDSQGHHWIDTTNDNWDAIKISDSGWTIVKNPPVRFIRTKSSRPFPTPDSQAQAKDAMRLFGLTNICKEDHLLVIAWVLECFRPETPYVVLELTGEQGSAKSTTQEVLRRFIDPNKVALRGRPKVTEDVYIAAGNSHLLSYENLSGITADLSDALCTISTGGGYSSRTLYTNGEETVIEAKNPIVLNGINRVITRPDLLDRAISVCLPTISARIDKSVHTADVGATESIILGGILNLFAESLAMLDQVNIDPRNKPRMADFARLGEAMSRALGNPDDTFLNLYIEHRKDAIVSTIDSSPVGRAIVDLYNERKQPYTGTVKGLLDVLDSYNSGNNMEHGEFWPKSPRGLGSALRRLAPALRQIGIVCDIDSKPRRDGIHCRVGHESRFPP